MKMYVWYNVLNDWTPGIAVAMATSLLEARRVILRDTTGGARERLLTELNRKPDHIFKAPHGAACSGGG